MTNEERSELFRELEKTKKRMETTCQNGSKKAWRKCGKKVLKLQKQLGLRTEPWMEEAFGRSL